MDIRTYYLELISGRKRGLAASFIKSFLSLISALYFLIINCRNILYKIKFFKERRLPCCVISIGNLSWGGTGKTPITEKVSNILSKNNIFHAVLSRGYKSKRSKAINVVSTTKEVVMKPPFAGDEAVMLAEKLKEVPVISGKDRFLTGKYAIEEYGVKALVLDDGYQHISLKRDLNILLIDSSKDFEKNKLIPGGSLREPFAALRRADLIVLTKTNQIDKNINSFKNFIKQYNKVAPIFKAVHKAEMVVDFKSKRAYEATLFKNKKVLAFSAIADPESFKKSLRDTGVEIIDFIEFGDHHYYSSDEIKAIDSKAKELKAEAIITTEKDVTRSSGLLSLMDNLFFLKLSVALDEEDEFERIILKYFEKSWEFFL